MIPEVQLGLALLTLAASAVMASLLLAGHGGPVPVLLFGVFAWFCGFWMRSLAGEMG